MDIKWFQLEVKSLFIKLLLEKAIKFNFKKVYNEKKIETSIPKSILKELLQLCTKQVHFTFSDEIYIQCDAMGSSLGPLLANIFMLSSKEEVLPTLSSYLCNWQRYVDDTDKCVVPEKVQLILHKLNSFHSSNQFTFELEKTNTTESFDVLKTRIDNNQMKTRMYRKETNSNIYISWKPHAQSNWRIGTLQNINRRKLLALTEHYCWKKYNI